MRPFGPTLLLCIFATVFSTLCFAVQPDRITQPLATGQVIVLKGNVHGLARPEFDQGRADAGQLMSGVSLVFKPSAVQQSALNRLLVQQQNPASTNYHRWLTPAQFADRFGMSANDLNKVVLWLQSQGFAVTRVSNSRTQIFFDGSVAQIEAAFHTEIHNYLVEGELHYANAAEPSVPAALSGVALGFQNLHNFQPKPRAIAHMTPAVAVEPNFTSHVTGSHFLAPGDFATIYDVQALYNSGIDGTGQKIAIVGQSQVNLADIDHFRSAAGLAKNDPMMIQVPNTGTAKVCSGDEGESDLDLEWAGGVARNATIVFVYAGLGGGSTCANRTAGAFNALQYAVDQDLAPVISSSYGNCEAHVGSSFASMMQLSAQQANSQGQTIISASGDSGAADCDFHVKSATHGLAVDIPAAIPEVTGAGGTEFSGDAQATASGTPPNASATTFWSDTTGGNDTISSALSYIPETGWNDTVTGGNIEASGGGASTFFSKPSWQTGAGVPADGKRDVPDIALSSSAAHDGYLFCSEDGAAVPTCTSGFRASNNGLAVIGGTSAAAPTFAGIVALLNQFLGDVPPAGLGNINPRLYAIAQNAPAAFNDVKTGSNIVPCTALTANCSSGTAQFGFGATVGYDQVTGLGSVNAFALAQAWRASLTGTSTALSPSTTNAIQGVGVTFTATVTPSGATGMVSFFNNGSTTALGSANLSSGTATFTTTALPPGTNNVTATYGGSGTFATSTSSAVAVTVTAATFQIATNLASVSAPQGQIAGPVPITVSSTNGFVVTNGGNSTTVLPVTYSCSGLPAASTCNFSPAATTSSTAVTLNIQTAAPVGQLGSPLGGPSGIFYASLLPGLLGIVLTASSRKRAVRGMRMLSLIVVLGFSTLWLGGCANTATTKIPGTPTGPATVTVNATTGGSSPIAAPPLTFMLQVTPK